MLIAPRKHQGNVRRTNIQNFGSSRHMKKLTFSILLLATAITFTSNAQQKLKPWQEWSRKDAETILNDSSWGKTQVETDTTEMMFRPQLAPDPRSGKSNADPVRDERGGATNQATDIKYRVRFLSAKPIRQAFARIIALDQPSEDPKVKQYMDDFVERKFDKWIAVTVNFESRDQRFSGKAIQAFGGATTGSLKNNTYLERKDGKRIYLHIYQPPSADGLGAKFIFQRIIDERPFLNSESGEVRFVSEIPTVNLNIRFKVADMMYDGKLEY